MSVRTQDKRPAEVVRLARVLSEREQRDPFWHRHLSQELRDGNPYALAFLARRGMEYDEREGIRQRKEATT
jgi:hypothetical protein